MRVHKITEVQNYVTTEAVQSAAYNMNEASGDNLRGRFFIRALLNPASANQNIQVEFQGRPGPSAGWFTIWTVTGATGGWYAVTTPGTAFTNMSEVVLLPQMRVTVTDLGGADANAVSCWIME